MKFGVKLILSIIFFNHTCSKFGYLVYLASTLRFLILWLIFIKFPQLIIHHLPLPISLLYQAQVIYLHERNFPSRTNKYAVFTTSVTKCHIFANKFFFFWCGCYFSMFTCLSHFSSLFIYSPYKHLFPTLYYCIWHWRWNRESYAFCSSRTHHKCMSNILIFHHRIIINYRESGTLRLFVLTYIIDWLVVSPQSSCVEALTPI